MSVYDIGVKQTRSQPVSMAPLVQLLGQIQESGQKDTRLAQQAEQVQISQYNAETRRMTAINKQRIVVADLEEREAFNNLETEERGLELLIRQNDLMISTREVDRLDKKYENIDKRVAWNESVATSRANAMDAKAANDTSLLELKGKLQADRAKMTTADIKNMEAEIKIKQDRETRLKTYSEGKLATDKKLATIKKQLADGKNTLTEAQVQKLTADVEILEEDSGAGLDTTGMLEGFNKDRAKIALEREEMGKKYDVNMAVNNAMDRLTRAKEELRTAESSGTKNPGVVAGLRSKVQRLEALSEKLTKGESTVAQLRLVAQNRKDNALAQKYESMTENQRIAAEEKRATKLLKMSRDANINQVIGGAVNAINKATGNTPEQADQFFTLQANTGTGFFTSRSGLKPDGTAIKGAAFKQDMTPDAYKNVERLTNAMSKTFFEIPIAGDPSGKTKKVAITDILQRASFDGDVQAYLNANQDNQSIRNIADRVAIRDPLTGEYVFGAQNIAMAGTVEKSLRSIMSTQNISREAAMVQLNSNNNTVMGTTKNANLIFEQTGVTVNPKSPSAVLNIAAINGIKHIFVPAEKGKGMTPAGSQNNQALVDTANRFIASKQLNQSQIQDATRDLAPGTDQQTFTQALKTRAQGLLVAATATKAVGVDQLFAITNGKSNEDLGVMTKVMAQILPTTKASVTPADEAEATMLIAGFTGQLTSKLQTKFDTANNRGTSAERIAGIRALTVQHAPGVQFSQNQNIPVNSGAKELGNPLIISGAEEELALDKDRFKDAKGVFDVNEWNSYVRYAENGLDAEAFARTADFDNQKVWGSIAGTTMMSNQRVGELEQTFTSQVGTGIKGLPAGASGNAAARASSTPNYLDEASDDPTRSENSYKREQTKVKTQEVRVMDNKGYAAAYEDPTSELNARLETLTPLIDRTIMMGDTDITFNINTIDAVVDNAVTTGNCSKTDAPVFRKAMKQRGMERMESMAQKYNAATIETKFTEGGDNPPTLTLWNTGEGRPVIDEITYTYDATRSGYINPLDGSILTREEVIAAGDLGATENVKAVVRVELEAAGFFKYLGEKQQEAMINNVARKGLKDARVQVTSLKGQLGSIEGRGWRIGPNKKRTEQTASVVANVAAWGTMPAYNAEVRSRFKATAAQASMATQFEAAVASSGILDRGGWARRSDVKALKMALTEAESNPSALLLLHDSQWQDTMIPELKGLLENLGLEELPNGGFVLQGTENLSAKATQHFTRSGLRAMAKKNEEGVYTLDLDILNK